MIAEPAEKCRGCVRRIQSICRGLLLRCAPMMLVLALLPCVGLAESLAQAVDAARARDGHGCEDGVGSTYVGEELDSALDNDTFDLFMARRDACGPDGVLGYTLGARCAPNTPAADDRNVEIYCSVRVWNPSDNILTLKNDQFVLASNSQRFTVSESAVGTVVPEDTLGTGLRVYPQDSAGGVIGFLVPAATANDDFVLIWRVPDAKTSTVNTWQRLRILLGDREQIFEETVDSQVDAAQSGGEGGHLRISNTTDLVSQPVTLGPGTYRVM